MNFNKNLQLGVSSLILILAGFIYGINPNKTLFILFEFENSLLDLKNIFRAIMGLYLSISIFLIYGIKHPEYWRTATIFTVILTGGLVFGRIISTIVDGFSLVFSIALIVELGIMIWGIFNLNKYKNKT